MKVLHVCAEFAPLVKTGGLADVLGALPTAQKKVDEVDVRVLLPGYPEALKRVKDAQCVAQCDTFAGPARVLYGHFQDTGLYLIEAPQLYDRPGNPYLDANFRDYADNFLRFALLSWVGCELACGLDSAWLPELIHAHDWHAGLVSAYLDGRGRPAKSVLTVHNLAYQGLFPAEHVRDIGLPPSLCDSEGLMFKGKLSYLKAGLYYSDHITTVSPTYAKEITAPEFGYGLEDLLQLRQRQGRLSGILNGVDENVWSPNVDPLLPARYNVNTLEEKAKNKRQLQKQMKLNVNEQTPLFAIVSRLDSQKGLDMVLKAIPDLTRQGGQLVLLGTGDPSLQEAFLEAQASYSGQVGVEIGYNNPLAHLMMGGADIILIPSRFEPCGLTQLYGMKYGALPLVRCTGGLADTVIDSSPENIEKRIARGFVFTNSDIPSLLDAIQRAFALWSNPAVWRDIQRYVMGINFSWQTAARSYCKLYRQLAD